MICLSSENNGQPCLDYKVAIGCLKDTPACGKFLFLFLYCALFYSSCFPFSMTVYISKSIFPFAVDFPCVAPTAITTIIPQQICPEMEDDPGYQPCSEGCSEGLYCDGKSNCVALADCPCRGFMVSYTLINLISILYQLRLIS